MRPSRLLVAGLVTLAIGGSVLRLRCAHAARDAAVVPRDVPRDANGAVLEVGPRERASDAPIPRDFDELATWVADANGPTDIALGPRVYRGDLSIHRPLRLRGTRGAVLEGTRQGTVLSIAADGVRLEDVHVRGSGRKHTTEDAAIRLEGKGIVVEHVSVDDALFGITLQRCEGCVVRGAHVRGRDDDPELRGDGVKLWESQDSQVLGSLIEDSRDVVVWYSRRVHLEGNVIRRSRYGSHFMYAHDGVVRNERLVGNVVGIFVMYSSRLALEGNVLAGARGAAGVGLGFKECDGALVRGNRLVANSTGIYLDRSPRSAATPLHVDGNVLALNDVALRLLGSQDGVHVTGNDLEGNGRLVRVEGGGDALRVDFANNYLSEYAGYDLDGDGIGDVPFEKKQLGSDLVATHPAAGMLEGTVALALVDGVAMAMPVLATKRLFTDPRPSMRPHQEDTER